MKAYDHKYIEKKWQDEWEKSGIYNAKNDSTLKKFYGLIEFPFPSGSGMHVGHLRSNTGMDVIARKRRMEGYNVLYPIGWDAFGLPTENYAIKTGIQPKILTKQNTDNFRRQLKYAGFSFDWSREVDTTDQAYYKWTQWIFLQMYKHDLAYKKKMIINWCPKDKIGLANEEVIDGKCERCGTPVEKREKDQWMLAITKYADRLDKDLDDVDYLEKIKIQQRNWIGKSEGAEIDFQVKPETEPTFYQFVEPGKIKENEPYVERNAIMALVKHWSEDKYIGLKWKKVDWETLITGGVEGSQTPEDAARAEIREETGYKNIKLVKNLGLAHSKFFHVPKDQNRNGHFHMFVFELENGEREEIANEEQVNHEIVWLSENDFESFKLPSSHRYVWELYKNGSKPEERHIKVFTTRPDTIFGVTYMVLALEHPLVQYFIHQSSNAAEIDEYISNSKNKSDIDRTAENKEKTGVELKGVKAINPATGKEIPVYVADYVLAHYGTGAIMAVPAHDERDNAFAKKYNLPIKVVVQPLIAKKDGGDAVQEDKPFVERNASMCLIKHWSEDKYLCSKWKTNDWQGFITGGIEEGEDVSTTSVREVEEETGYTSAKFIKSLGTVNSQFYHDIKQVNRYAHFHVVYLELQNSDRKEVSEEEQKLHEIVWVEGNKVRDFVNRLDLKIAWDMLSPDFVFNDSGILVDSGTFTGKKSEEIKREITAFVGGKIVTTYKLRDWVFSRQRYWGEPIPMIWCPACAEASAGKGWVPVPEKDLPVILPEVENYQPTDDGESPLSKITEWVNTTCPKCGGEGKRETDTMPNWAGSSWYYLRYTDPKNNETLASQDALNYWVPEGVDWYNGGMEHTTLHLLYSRFWHKFLFDIKQVPTHEPYKKRTSHGLILAADGSKFSKSKGNGVDPDVLIETVGADALRLYEMFMGPFEQAVSWSNDGVVGPRRFLERVWKLKDKVVPKLPFDAALESVLHKTMKKVSEDIESMQFNTAVSALMILVNEMDSRPQLAQSYYQHLLSLLAPFAPHIVEELWQELGHETSIHLDKWPHFNLSKIQVDEVVIGVQINGKVRAELHVAGTFTEEDIKQQAMQLPEVKKWIDGKEIKKVVYVKGRVINIVAQ